MKFRGILGGMAAIALSVAACSGGATTAPGASAGAIGAGINRPG